MASATSVTGIGQGSSGKYTVKELAILANGPSILIAGRTTASSALTSPPSATKTVVFPEPLEGSSDNYVVILTSLNGSPAYVYDMSDNDDGNFESFSLVIDGAEDEADVMYIVTKVGQRPAI